MDKKVSVNTRQANNALCHISKGSYQR